MICIEKFIERVSQIKLIQINQNMENPITSSDSSSFEDLAKDQDVKDDEKDEVFMDILGNNQLTKKVGHFQDILNFC